MGLTAALDKPVWCSGSCCVSLYFCSTGPDWGGEVVLLADLETEVYFSAYLGVYSITLLPLEEGLPAFTPVCTQRAPSVPGQCSTTGLCHLHPLDPGWVAVIFSEDEESRFLSPVENGDHEDHRK